MSKNVATQPLSDNTRKLIIIIAIVLVAVIILSVALALILKTEEKTPAADSTDNSNSSTLPIRNGDFLYSNSDATGYPHTAVNWTKYGYKAQSGSTHDFEEITGSDNSLMGIVDVSDDNWDKVAADIAPELPAGATLQNPQKHSDELDDDNVYMIYNKQATSASILSDSVSVSSGASVKITVWLNMSQVTSGNAVIMIQKSATSAKEENWYAYDFTVKATAPNSKEGENGWIGYEFFIFNREASTQYIRVSVGLGDVYQDVNAEGILFVDDISYETVTADEYRQQVDNHSDDEVKNVYVPYKIIENEDIDDESQYAELEKAEGTESVIPFPTSQEYVDEAKYSPFTNRDDFKDGETGFTIYKITQKANSSDITALRLKDVLTLQSSPIDKDHYHISFWLRVEKTNGHAATKANVYIQKQVGDDEWEDLDTFSAITTSQEIDTDDNCGWVKYDIYLKPSTADTDKISILFVLGHKDKYTESEINNGEVPRGSLYVTSPAYEQISYKDYNNASSGTYVKKIDLVGNSASTSVTNGSFSDVNNTGKEPTSWTPVFAGDNAIYKDGKGDELESAKKEYSLVAGSGINQVGSAVDDAQKRVLQVSTNGTNFGYISNDITLSARTVYVFSVVVKLVDATNPYIYLVDNSKDREDAIVARAEKADADGQRSLDHYFDYALEDSTEDVAGWVRYYLVYVTGAESASVRIALFNGKIDDTEHFATGTILYDNVKMKSIGTYSFVEDEDNEDATNYLVQFSANSGYEDAIEDLFGKTDEDGKVVLEKDYNDILNGDSEILATLDDNAFTQPDEDTWNENSIIPEDEEDSDSGEEDTTTTTTSEVDWALLMSVISSVLMVAALLIVFVVKLFQRKRPRSV
ncbi:MAG: hypothetical protein J1F66_02810 [Clostridiales bacterium]|nr:hypothetical protein [Clostridiales bacterium]